MRLLFFSSPTNCVPGRFFAAPLAVTKKLRHDLSDEA
jgi:hypothetical protein